MKNPPKFRVDKAACKKSSKRSYIEKIKPGLVIPAVKTGEEKSGEIPIRRRVTTLHEGSILYLKYWNYWVRAGVRADDRANLFFPDFENPNTRIFNMISDIGVTTAPSNGEVHIWEKIRAVWAWLRNNVNHNSANNLVSSSSNNWPSIDEYAAYYEANGYLVWAACFSKAHLFASILGRVGIPRWRIVLITAHHTENGAPPTASHVYVAVYVNEHWYYLDPTGLLTLPVLPEFSSIGSVGFLNTADYMHPFKGIPIPLSGFTRIPMLNE
ncbi:MAG: transglutaminase domain-containing protein [Candidatus Sabulitectum sp.]|nr:transglutaminase domain-containing protein [Candidatus Sabulitectum sp.]